MEHGMVTPTQEELRRTSDALLADLDRLAELEATKRDLQPDDPQLVTIAAEVERLAHRIVSGANRQLGLTLRTEALVEEGSPEAPTASIADTPRDLHVILEEWRAAERMAASATPGSPEALTAAERSAGLREEYRRGHEARRRELEKQ